METYGKTELEKFYEKRKICREIVKEITDFGVSQEQLLQIIYLLSLNIENNEHMEKLSKLSKELLEKNKVSLV